MFKVGERRRFSFGSFTVDKEFGVDFQITLIMNAKPKIMKSRVVKVYRLTGKGTVYLGITDQGRIFKLEPEIVLEHIQ